MTALSHIRVLELTHMVSGPYAGMLLADLGAETIKVEPPGEGEMTRALLADMPQVADYGGSGPYFLTMSRNKKSVTLDLKSDAGLALFYDLVHVSDVVLTNYRAGVAERLKIDHDRLAAINPRIVTASITGFGETGPDRDRPAYDMVAQAVSGVMSITGLPDGPPLRAGIPMADLSASLMAVVGVLAALSARERSGRGQHVDISMLDTQISMLTYYATITLLTGESPARMGSGHFHHVPYDVYPCRDGYLILAVVTDAFWKRLVVTLDLPELDTEEHRRREGRLRNRATIDAGLAAHFQTGSRDEWVAKLQAAAIPCAPVNDVGQALQDPQVAARNMVAQVDMESGVELRVPGNAVKLSETPGETFASPPRLGEHNEVVFGGLLGKSEQELEELRAAGAI